MTDKIKKLLKDVQTVYEGKGMEVHPNSFDELRVEIMKLDNINKQQSEQIEKMKCCENCEGTCSFMFGEWKECWKCGVPTKWRLKVR